MSEQNLHNLLMGGNQTNPGNKMQFPSHTNTRGYTSHREAHASGDVVGREFHDVGGEVGNAPGSIAPAAPNHGLRNVALAGGAAYLANRYMKKNPGALGGQGQPGGGLGGQPVAGQPGGGGKLARNLLLAGAGGELYSKWKKARDARNATPGTTPAVTPPVTPPAPPPQVIRPEPTTPVAPTKPVSPTPGGGQSVPSAVDPNQAAAEDAEKNANAAVENAAAQGQGGTIDPNAGTGGFRRGGRVEKRYC